MLAVCVEEMEPLALAVMANLTDLPTINAVFAEETDLLASTHVLILQPAKIALNSLSASGVELVPRELV